MAKRGSDISDPHLIAELASTYGLVGPLAGYLRQQPNPSPNVIQSISRHLSGDDDGWHLQFRTRNGRPPVRKAEVRSIWEAGQEKALSHTLFQLGAKLADPANSIGGRQDVNDLVRTLADALDPGGSSKWKLVYTRHRAGNPTTALRKDIKMAELGITALQLYSELCNWPAVQEKLKELGLTGDDDKARKKAVQFAKRAKKTFRT